MGDVRHDIREVFYWPFFYLLRILHKHFLDHHLPQENNLGLEFIKNSSNISVQRLIQLICNVSLSFYPYDSSPAIIHWLINIYWNFTYQFSFFLSILPEKLLTSHLSESIVSFIPTILIITKASFLINPNYFIIRTCWFALIFMTSNPFKVTTLPFIILLSLSFLLFHSQEMRKQSWFPVTLPPFSAPFYFFPSISRFLHTLFLYLHVCWSSHLYLCKQLKKLFTCRLCVAPCCFYSIPISILSQNRKCSQ